MDILKEIRSKLGKVSENDRPSGINAILAHIEIAEKYYNRGNAEKDDHYFTDVIYRTNHAFEGILKEAYEVIEEQNASNKSPYEIEQYLSSNDVFNERVMQLFINYRQSWRNPSTHDYQLFFGSQEAFLAIVTVSSFVNILLDQIVEKLAYQDAKVKAFNHVNKYKELISSYNSLSLMEKSSKILVGYAKYFKEHFDNLYDLPEPELIGSLMGYISAFEPEWNISANQIVSVEGGKINPDIIINDSNEKLIIQFKRGLVSNIGLFYGEISAEYEQLTGFLKKSDIKMGIVFHTPADANYEIITGNSTSKTIREIYTVEDSVLPSDDEYEDMSFVEFEE